MCGPSRGRKSQEPSWDEAHPLTQSGVLGGAMGSPLALGLSLASPVHAGSRVKCEWHEASGSVGCKGADPGLCAQVPLPESISSDLG